MGVSVNCSNSVISNKGYTLNFKCREDGMPYEMTASRGDEQSVYDIEYCTTKAGYPEVVLINYGTQLGANAEPVEEFHLGTEKSVLRKITREGNNGKQAVRSYVYAGSGKSRFDNIQGSSFAVMEFVRSLIKFNERVWKNIRLESAE